MKKIKCIKCNLVFKDRQDKEDFEIEAMLCWNCRFVWKVLRITTQCLPKKINREVIIDLDKIVIRKKL